MLIYDDIYRWKGWGGRLALASGSCHLCVYDQRKEESEDLALMKQFIVIVSDVPGNKMSVRSCAGHIATIVTKDFSIDPHRMLWIEYYPVSEYGKNIVRVIPERYESVEFIWKRGLAIQPKWRSLKPPMLDTVKRLMKSKG